MKSIKSELQSAKKSFPEPVEVLFNSSPTRYRLQRAKTAESRVRSSVRTTRPLGRMNTSESYRRATSSIPVRPISGDSKILPARGQWAVFQLGPLKFIWPC